MCDVFVLMVVRMHACCHTTSVPVEAFLKMLIIPCGNIEEFI